MMTPDNMDKQIHCIDTVYLNYSNDHDLLLRFIGDKPGIYLVQITLTTEATETIFD